MKIIIDEREHDLYNKCSELLNSNLSTLRSDKLSFDSDSVSAKTLNSIFLYFIL